MEMNVKMIRKDIIRPSSPTPNHLRIFKLCLLDQLSHSDHGSMLLFYSTSKPYSRNEKSHLLKRSLSETLIRFYPIAGRVKDNSIIECNDEGVVYLEAQADCLLSKLLEKPNHQVMRIFIPVEHVQLSTEPQPLLLIQATFFECGGLAIGVSISHKISDAKTVCTFIQGWAATALGIDHGPFRPRFNASSIFPPQNLPSFPAFELNQEKGTVTKRFVFYASEISTLKAKIAGQSVSQPTRVEAVTALIWKCLMKASRSNTEQLKNSVLIQTVNIRKKMEPPLSEHCMGNLLGSFAIQETESEVAMESMVGKMRKGIQDFDESYIKKIQQPNVLTFSFERAKETESWIRGGNTDLYIFTSLCRFPFYSIDFGWGKPTWVVPPRDTMKNIVALIDTRDGDGIEAWVTLKQQDMAFFQRDQQLLAAASLNPSVFSTIMPNSCL